MRYRSFAFSARSLASTQHHSLGKTRFVKLQGFGGWPPRSLSYMSFRSYSSRMEIDFFGSALTIGIL